MRKILWYCDKCGKEFTLSHGNETGHLNVLIKTPNDFYNSGHNRADLCLDCYNELCDLVEEFNLRMIEFTNLDDHEKETWKKHLKEHKKVEFYDKYKID